MKILHFYPDMMNLYGEYANVLILERCLEQLGKKAEVHTLSMGEKKNIDGYDLYFMGAGTERKQKLVLEELRAYAEPLKKAQEEGKVFLFTGNSFELFGKTIKDARGKIYECLGLFSFETEEVDCRILGDCLGNCSLVTEPIVGFTNKCSKIHGVKTPLFTLKMGTGNISLWGGEGVMDKNFFGTHLTGPVLLKNPALLRAILALLTGQPVEELAVPHLQQAYEITSRALQSRLKDIW